MTLTRLVVLISGTGTNLQAILDACERGDLPARVVAVVSNRRDAYGLERARRHGVPALYHPFAPYRAAGRDRREYDADLADLVARYAPDWVVLAGWMHVLSPAFFCRVPNRAIHLPPALSRASPRGEHLPSPSAPYRRGAITATGVMVHLVPDEGVDCGPVIAQATVPILPDDTLESLEARIHAVEHELLVGALKRLISGEHPLVEKSRPA